MKSEPPVTPENPPRSALVVEDEWLLRQEIVRALHRDGWEVVESATGEYAVALLERGHRFESVVTDIQLSGHLSGWDVAEALRQVEPQCRVIYTSGNSADRSRQVQGSEFFGKPYRVAAILNACRSLP
jgi:CheY-like chemotaxis protein